MSEFTYLFRGRQYSAPPEQMENANWRARYLEPLRKYAEFAAMVDHWTQF